jgi:hypothetical protein
VYTQDDLIYKFHIFFNNLFAYRLSEPDLKVEPGYSSSLDGVPASSEARSDFITSMVDSTPALTRAKLAPSPVSNWHLYNAIMPNAEMVINTTAIAFLDDHSRRLQTERAVHDWAT